MKQIKKVLQVIGFTASAIILLLLSIIGYILFFLPNVGSAAEMQIERTPARIERGRYLANNVMGCMSCHSSRDWEHPGSPVKEGTLGVGGDKFTQDTTSFLGAVAFPNITPAALSNWTDGEIFRAITSGVNKHGRALVPIMPYEVFRNADEEDIKSVIAYLRTLPAVGTMRQEKKERPFALDLLSNIAVSKPAFRQRPPLKDTIAYGKYLTTVASCILCHSPFNGPMGVDMEQAFSGGPKFAMQAVDVTPINLTPDKATGIGLWSREHFINKFRRYRDSSILKVKMSPEKDFTSIMPWASFAGMKDEDLSAIYAYLKTLKPIHNKVVQVVRK